jgi:excisionase family DNA binding protein
VTVERTQLLTPDQVAERWQVPVAHVHRLARDGRVPSVMIGRYRRFRPDEIETWERGDGVGESPRSGRV